MRRKLKRKTDEKVDDYIPDIVFHAELKAEDSKDSDDLFIQGFASTADLDRIDDIVEPSAFKKTIKEFMRNPVLLLNHGHNADGRVPVGKVVEAEIKPKGLFVKAFISKTEDILREKIKEGLYKAFSFGFRIINSDVIRKTGKSIRKITDLELFEISVVSIPMNRRALFSVVKGLECGTDLIYENDFVEGIKGDLDLAHERICSIEDEVKSLKKIYDFSERQWFKEALEDNLTDTNEHFNEYFKDVIIEEQKPAPEETENEIRIRKKDPGLFRSDSFKRITLQSAKPRVFGVIGKLKSKTSTTLQSLRFPKADGWSKSKAVAWDKAHKSYNEVNCKEESSYIGKGIACSCKTCLRRYSDYILDNDVFKGIDQEDNLHNPIIDIVKSFEEEVEELKAGRVLSGSNRKTLDSALEAMESASVALKAVLDIQEADSRTIQEEPEKKTDDQLSDELIDKVAAATIDATYLILN